MRVRLVSRDVKPCVGARLLRGVSWVAVSFSGEVWWSQLRVAKTSMLGQLAISDRGLWFVAAHCVSDEVRSSAAISAITEHAAWLGGQAPRSDQVHVRQFMADTTTAAASAHRWWVEKMRCGSTDLLQPRPAQMTDRHEIASVFAALGHEVVSRLTKSRG